MARNQKFVVNPELIRPGMITKVTDMPNATEKVVTEVAHFFNITKGETEEILTFMGKYIKNVMGEGTMEAIALPHFGKFAPNIKLLQAKTRRKRTVHNCNQLLELAIRSKQTNFKQQPNALKPDLEETALPLPDEEEDEEMEEGEEEM